MTLYPIFLRCLDSSLAYATGSEVEPLLDWAKHFLPKHFVKTPSKMHHWLAEQLDRLHSQRGTKLNVLAPRNSAKSTIAALAYPLRELLTKREPYIWLISDTKSQAHTHLENIKAELESNPLLAEAYPNACGKGILWREGSIRLKNGGVIEAFGTGQRLRGRKRNENRPTLIICDDLQNDQHMLSASQREKSRNWFHGTLLKAGSQQTNIIHLATALHREAIALELLRTPGWLSKTFQAIEKFPKNMSLWQEWESLYTNKEPGTTSPDTLADEFYEANREAMNEGAVVLWKEQESLYDLMKMRVEGGYTTFDREKQNMPINPDVCEFPEHYFDDTIWYDAQERGGASPPVSALALDPSKGTDSALGDYSAFVYVALGNDGIFYVDAFIKRLPVSEMVATGVELYQQYRPTVFGIEANQFQELLIDEFERQIPDTKIYPLRNTLNKTIRIRRLDSYLAMRKLRFNSQSPSCRLLVEQLRSFPIGSHDDGPDALEMAIRMIEML